MSPICSLLRSSFTLTSFSNGRITSRTPLRFAARLDEEHVAADRRPGQTNGDAGPPGALGNFDVGPEPWRAEKLLHALGCDFRAFGLAFGDAPRALAADAAYFAFQAAHAGFTR